MMWQPALAASLLLLGQVSAGVVGDAGLLVRRVDGTEQKMRRYVDSIVEPKLERRQTSTSTTNVTEWDAQTMAACESALTALNGNAGNPSGMAACYNIPYLDNSTGVFQADLRLFTISAPSGSFANIPTQNVMVGLSYTGATVSAVNASTLTSRDLVSLISWPRSADSRKRQAAVPTMTQSYAFVGQINKDLLPTTTDLATLEKLLSPTVTLTGMQTNGSTVTTSLSGSEADYVNGVFAKAATTVSKSVVQSPIQTLVVASDAPFVLPGLKILIAPVGAIITGVWAALFIATVGYGTVRRMQFRDSYRRRSAVATKGNVARI